MKKYIMWAPRVLGIIFAIFISLFALDAFGEGIPILEAVVGFLIHLVPTYIVLILLWVGWKRPFIGGVLFFATGASYIISAQGMHWIAFVLIAGPAILTGALFILSRFHSTTNKLSV